MNGCCFNPIRAEILGIIETTPPEPPVESNWCVQWVLNANQALFPCNNDAVDVNGNTNSGEVCAGLFFITDFNGNANHTFYYDNQGSNWYVQVIRPSSDPSLETLGTYAYDALGFSFGPYNIIPTDQNCVLRTFQAVFNVNDPSTEGLSSMVFDDFSYDITVPFYPFDTPNAGDLYLNDNIGTARIGPESSVDVQINGNEITLTIVSLIGIVSGSYSTDVGGQTQFNFTEI